MIIDNAYFNADLSDVLQELQAQLALNKIQLLQKIKNLDDNIMVQCPYHGNGQERRPSAGIRKSDGVFHCFACNETHSLTEVISHCFGHDDPFGRFGWQWLNKNFATVAVEDRKDVHLDFGRRSNDSYANRLDSGLGGDCRNSNSTQSGRENNGYVLEEELNRYRYTHPYWAKRGITDERIIELFDLGYDRKTDCITFPVRDVHGRCLFVARRSTKTKYFNYPQGVEKPVYGLFEICQLGQFPKEIIVCESMLDALTAWEYGKVAVALNGLGNELQFKQLRELPCRKLILATDNDKAGLEARKRIRENVPNKIITEYILPEGKKDLNELTNAEFSKLEEIF